MSEEDPIRELYSVRDIELLSDLDFLIQPLTALFGQLPVDLKVGEFSMVEDGAQRTYSMVLAVKQSVFLELPGLQGFGLGIVRDAADEWPLVYCEVDVGPSLQALTVRHFPLRVEIANPLLRPVAIEGQAEVLPGFSFEIEGGFSVASDLSVSATLESFSVPPFEIVGTGLVLALDDCRLIVRAEDVDDAITDLGFNQNFRGLHAAAALFDWDVPLQLDNRTLPGIHAQFGDVALGNQGVSLDAQLSWPVVYQNGQFDEAQTELLGWFADPDWRCALAGLRASIRANVPTALAAVGYVRVPLLDAILELELYSGYAGQDAFQLGGALRSAAGETLRVPLGRADYRLELAELETGGTLLAGGELVFSGQTGCTLALPGFDFSAGAVELTFEHAADSDHLRLELGQVEIEPFGQLEQARVEILARRDQQGGLALETFELLAELAWSDLAGRIAFAQVPDAFPLPPDDAQVTLHVRWADDLLLFSLEAELADVDQLWRFLPEDQRPLVASAAIRIELTASGAGFDGELGIKVRFQLPEVATFPGFAAAGLGDLVRVDTGDEQRWIDAEFGVQLSTEDGTPTGALSATLANPVALAFSLPGLVLPQPPLEVNVTEVVVELSQDTGQSEGEFRLRGDFALRPILPSGLGGLVPAAMAIHLERLLAVAQLYDLVGYADLRLGSGAHGAYLALDCRFSNAGLEVDLFDMLAGVARNLPGGGAQGNEIDLDIEVSFELSGLSLAVGRVPDSGMDGEDGVPFLFGLSCELGFAGQFTEIAFELSDESLSFGIVELAIPVAVPPLPLSRADLDELRDATGRWDLAIWEGEVEPLLNARMAGDQNDLQQARALLEQLERDGANGAHEERELFELRYRTIPALQKDIFHFTGKKFLTEAVLAVYQLLGQLSGSASQASYQSMVEVYQDAVDLALGSLHIDTQLQFVISDARFLLPFNDPSAIRVEGGGALRGFAPDDPLAPLGDLVFKLGLSADAIYFAVEGGADPIPLPDFGRYPGNAILFDRLLIGYGYSKNSLQIDFAGELRLSPALIDDADSSQRLGLGVRLPRNSRLRFKLDLIPVVLGEVDFLLPLLAFDVDLRSESPLPAAGGAACSPTWDGLQLIAPGVLRAGFKRARFSPFFGPLPAPNYLYAFDLQVGDERLGFTQVCDDYQVITPLLGTTPIPFLADATPYFERLCSSLRLAGFGIHFDLYRPFPRPNPLLIFELMGFLSDPSLPIDPAGHLANLMWAEVRNARITLPPAVLGMFPEQGRAISRELDLRVNVGTVIAIAQQLVEVIERIESELARTGDSIAALVQRLVDNPPPLRLDDLLDSLPRDLRRLELNGSFVGFDASAVFLLASPDSLRRGIEAPAEPPTQNVRWVSVAHDRFARNPLVGWRAVNHGLKRGQGDWTISRGALVQNNNVGDNSAGRYGAMLIRETEPLSDLRISVDMHSTDNDGMGVVFHVQADNTFYRFRITAEQNSWQLMRLKRGVTRMLQETATAFLPGKDYRVRIEVRSVRQAAASLPAALDGRRVRLAPRDLELGRQALSRFTTHIQIWVNEALWCDLADSDAPLTEGQVGLDSWWNKGARFDNFLVERAGREALDLAHAAHLAGTRSLVALSTGGSPPVVTATGGAPWVAEDLAHFTDADLLDALATGGTAAVVVTARVRVFERQSYHFVGVMQTDGGFRLLSGGQLAPLTLRVAGIDLGLATQLQGRLLLEGRSAGADSWARIEATLFADWSLLPSGNGTLARLLIGSPGDPAGLSLGSRGDFRLQGSGALHLFDDALLVDGTVDISDRHLMVAGHAEFAPAVFLAGTQRLLELSLDCEGRVGPGPHFGLAGGATLKLLGKAFSAASVTLAPDGIGLETRLDANAGSWDINGFELKDAELALRGRVTFGAAVPEVLFEGAGRLQLADVRVNGQCRVAAGAADWCLAAAGNLHWQGRDWLQGAVELCRDRLTVQGQTTFALDLTPAQLPAGIQVAGLRLNATVGGSFGVRSSGRLKACNFHVDWMLAVRLPGQQAEQMLPLASQRLHIELDAIPSKSSVKLADLIAIDGIDLLPLDGISIPLPTLSPDGGIDIYLHSGVPVNPPAVDLPVPIVVLDPNVTDPPLQPALDLGIAKFYLYTPSVDVPAVELPIPVLSDRPPSSNPNQAPLVSIPQIGIGQVPLGGVLRLEDVAIGLQLVWKDGALGIKVVQTGQFFAFDSLPAIPLFSAEMVSGMTRFSRG